MNHSKIILDQNLGSYVTIPEVNEKVRLELSDDLTIASLANNLPSSYESKIFELLKNSDVWFYKSVEKIYKELGCKVSLNLIGIHLLSEDQDDDFIFGVEFGSPEVNEHGIGLKISLSSMDIIDYGDADIAYYK
ncbi:hypothetical protein MK385_06320 [Streptococcus oralis]|uniref:hypothetical protein n=1 Tax=Streptococcus oralis TaxID=1303 RepID=UPI00228508AC|nr:hypothetical protein [Streptococcus oralis]MCY7062395.1 hypothetical protein [Streptococcus oralis]